MFKAPLASVCLCQIKILPYSSDMNIVKANKTKMDLNRCSSSKCSKVIDSVADSLQALIKLSKKKAQT